MAASSIESPKIGIEQARMARNTAESAIFGIMEVGKDLMVVPPQGGGKQFTMCFTMIL
jgi:hypothetical protein